MAIRQSQRNSLRPPLIATTAFASEEKRGDSKECCRPFISSQTSSALKISAAKRSLAILCFFVETVRRYTNATTITKRMVAELIQYIEVYPAVKEDGVTNQRVTIHYNCIGAFEVPDRRKIPDRDVLLETEKGVALSYAPTQIAI